MYDSPAGQAVRASLEDIAATGTTPSREQLERLTARVCQATDELRSLGWPPERVIVRLKELSRETLPAGVDTPTRELVTGQIVQSALQRYFGG